MEPENTTLEKEVPFGNLSFSGSIFNFGGGYTGIPRCFFQTQQPSDCVWFFVMTASLMVVLKVCEFSVSKLYEPTAVYCSKGDPNNPWKNEAMLNPQDMGYQVITPKK